VSSPRLGSTLPRRWSGRPRPRRCCKSSAVRPEIWSRFSRPCCRFVHHRAGDRHSRTHGRRRTHGRDRSHEDHRDGEAGALRALEKMRPRSEISLCFRGQIGKHLLTSRLTGFDTTRTSQLRKNVAVLFLDRATTMAFSGPGRFRHVIRNVQL